MFPIRVSLPLAFFSMSALLFSCSGDDSPCSRAVSKLQTCNLVRSGSNICQDPDADELSACGNDCIQAASCSQLTAFMCDESSSSEAVESCFESCRLADATLSCDGGDVRYGSADKCDGFEDCDDGADEAGCPTFACTSGEKVPLADKCDGLADCKDASDENNCPMFQCKNGEKVAAEFKCDSEVDCSDGSDELGCSDSEDFLMCPMT